MDVAADDLLDAGPRHAVSNHGPNRTAALDKAHDRHLVAVAGTFGEALFIDEKCFVRLDDLAASAKLTLGSVAHRFAQSVRHEPGRLVGHAKRAVQLMTADALLAR